MNRYEDTTASSAAERARYIAEGRIGFRMPERPYRPGTAMTVDQLNAAGYRDAANAKQAREAEMWQSVGDPRSRH